MQTQLKSLSNKLALPAIAAAGVALAAGLQIGAPKAETTRTASESNAPAIANVLDMNSPSVDSLQSGIAPEAGWCISIGWFEFCYD